MYDACTVRPNRPNLRPQPDPACLEWAEALFAAATTTAQRVAARVAIRTARTSLGLDPSTSPRPVAPIFALPVALPARVVAA